MIENENNKLPSEDDGQIKYTFKAGEKASDASGNKVDDSQFQFVQKDKKIHDTKFTTRPTTFLRDAFHRFRKNKSSVVGGIILGTLFVLAIILPFQIDYNAKDADGKTTITKHIQTLPYDIKNKHAYETNLPMKLFPTGSGFWDGTRTLENQTLPYALNADGTINYDQYTGSYDDEATIVKVKNMRTGYSDHSSNSGSGGYAKIEKEAKAGQTGYMYFTPLKFDLNNCKYEISYTLGTREQDGYDASPEWALLLYGNDGSINYLTAFTKDYGEAVEKEDKNMTVTAHKTETKSLNDLIKSANVPSSVLSSQFSVGFIMKSEEDLKTAFYLKDFEITGKKNDGSDLSASDKRNLRLRSFGTKNALVKDANTLVQMEKMTGSSINQSYWSAVTSIRFDSVDTYTMKCDLVIDPYNIAYGYKKGMQVSTAVFTEWIEKGYIEYDFTGAGKGNAGAPKTFKVTEKGEQSKEVYVREVNSQTSSTANGETIYTMECTVLMYRYLGYSSMPIHLLGTEFQGKDILKYVFSGLRTSLILGILVALVNITIGVIWGSISGYFGGTVDIVMERITDILAGIPWIILMTVLTLKLGQNFFVFALSLCLTGWIGTEATTRSQFYRYRGREYVLAAKTLGAKAPRLIFRHILPNAVGTIITSSVLMIPSTIFSEATISYLGLGLQNLDSLGVILSDSQKTLSEYPYQLVIPAIIISLLMICFNLFGNGLRDAFNPSLKGSE